MQVDKSNQQNDDALQVSHLRNGAQYQIMEIILEQIKKFLETKPSQSQLTDFINHFEAKQLKPTVNFNQIDSKTLKTPTFVYARLMVQDMRDSYFYISLAAERKEYYTPNDSFCLYKYGQITGAEPKDVEDSQKFMQVMTDRTLVICTEVRYQTKWLNELEKKTSKIATIQLEVDGECQFKLGQVVNMVALYDPVLQKLFFVRKATQDQAESQGFQILRQLSSKELDILSVKHKFMNYLSGFCSESFAQYLLLILISQQPLFLGCQANITPLIEDFYPRVTHLKIVHPIKEPLFPFKNEESELQLTPMQMSSLPTFIILDLSQFSKSQQVILQGTELSNFAALKQFVQDGKTIYAWQMGEGHFDHNHRGVVVKAAKLLNPQFNPSNQQIFIDFSNGVKISEQDKQEIRSYLQKVLTIHPVLQEEQRKLIEKNLHEEISKLNVGQNFGSIMKLAKLLARSEGRTSISFQNYQRAKSLILNHQVAK